MAEKSSRRPIEVPIQYQLGDLVVDLERGEVRNGERISVISGQPLAILTKLLEEPERCSSREELKASLWPDESHGDLDQRLNAAIRLLRKSLGDSSESPRYLTTLRGRGYQIRTPVVARTRTSNPRRTRPALAGRLSLLVSSLILIGVMTASWIRTLPVSSSPIDLASDKLTRIAVLPIDVIGDDHELEIIAALFEEDLKTRLTRLAPSRIELVGRETAERFHQEAEVAAETDLVVEAKIIDRGGDARLFVHLRSLHDSSSKWSKELDPDQPVSSWFHELTRELRRFAGMALPRSASIELGTNRPEAYRLYLKAAGSLRLKNYDRALGQLESALRVDPDYVQALVMAGRTLHLRGNQSQGSPEQDFEAAEASYFRALRLDPYLADAHLSLGILRFYGQWQWRAAEDSFLEALRYGPGRADVHHQYAWYLLASQRFEDAKSAMEEAIRLDPLGATLHSNLGWFHYRVRDYPGALTLCHSALDLQPELSSALDCRHRTLARLGRFDQALDYGLEIATLSDQKIEEIRALPAPQGYSQFLLSIESSGDTPGSATLRAMNFAAAGERERALRALSQALVQRDPMLVLIDVTPEFDQLASLPRFEAIRMAVIGSRETPSGIATTAEAP